MKTSFLLSAVFFLLCLRGALLSGAPAGMVLYFQTEDEVYLLLADHTEPSERGWAAFGGGSEDGESAAETAAREAEEETRNFFSRKRLLEGIVNESPVVDGTFHLFFHEIDFVPARRIQNNPLNTDDFSYHERKNYAWVPYSEIRSYLSDDDGDERKVLDERYLPAETTTGWLWGVWVRNMRVAFEAGAIPWEREVAPSEANQERSRSVK